MGNSAMTPLQRQETLKRIDNHVILEQYEKESYLDNYGFLKEDRFVYTIALSNNPNWHIDRAEDLRVRFNGSVVDAAPDLRPMIAKQLALLNWINTVHGVDGGRLRDRFCIGYHDKAVYPINVPTNRIHGEALKVIDIQVLIGGDIDVMRYKVMNRLSNKCKEMIGFVEPNWKFDDGTLRVVNCKNRQITQLLDFNVEDVIQYEYTAKDLRKELKKFYTAWYSSPVYLEFQQCLRKYAHRLTSNVSQQRESAFEDDGNDDVPVTIADPVKPQQRHDIQSKLQD